MGRIFAKAVTIPRLDQLISTGECLTCDTFNDSWWQTDKIISGPISSRKPAIISGARGVTSYLQVNVSLIGTTASSTRITMYHSQPPYTKRSSGRAV